MKGWDIKVSEGYAVSIFRVSYHINTLCQNPESHDRDCYIIIRKSWPQMTDADLLIRVKKFQLRSQIREDYNWGGGSGEVRGGACMLCVTK